MSKHHPDTTTITESYMEIYDVVVIGAGPIGLATALGLRQRGIENILVIDQTRAFRQVGQGLDLLPNGLKSLKYLAHNAYEKITKPFEIKEQTPPKTSPTWVTRNFQGQVIRTISLEYDRWVKDYGVGRVSTSWYNLQTTLRELLPQERVKANHRCLNIVDEPENGCVRIDCLSHSSIEANPYAYWVENQPQNSDIIPQQTETKSIRAKLIVAADGINSTVRKVLYKDSPYNAFAKPEYSGFAAITCRKISEIPKTLEAELEETFFQGSRILTIVSNKISKNSPGIDNPRLILFHPSEREIGYLIHLPLPLDILQEKSGSSLINLAVQEFEKAGFPESLKQLVSISPPENMQQRPYYIHRATLDNRLRFPSTANPKFEEDSAKIQAAWSVGRVVLVGDAAHGMPPFLAQGANQGLEDALTVATLIAKIADENQWDNLPEIASAFEKYEAIRRPMMAYIQQATLTQFTDLSEKEWQEYNQQVYCRNFE